MRIVKIGVKKGVISISYQEKRKREEEGWDGHAIALKDQARKEFFKALSDMGKAAGKIIGTSKKWCETLNAEKVSMIYSDKDDAKAVCVTCTRSLAGEYEAADLRFTSPPVVAQHFGQALADLEAEAERYIRGDRVQGVLFAENPPGEAEKAELVDKAKAIILETGRAATSVIQRRLRLGYTAAAGLMDALEAAGVIGPPRGSEPREILIPRDGAAQAGAEPAPKGKGGRKHAA